ncbi:MAG TPA: UxaA family hydrolase [Burkholderiales bacterium]|jgi:altronate dehydratase small subunit|nr:UxaA family hydrolase [Burkholderiales bacterium]
MSKQPNDTDPRVMVLAPGDNVAIAKTEIAEGTTLEVIGQRVTLKSKVDIGHKFAFKLIRKGERIVKYRAPIGSATRDIAPGEYLHTHNVTSNYLPTYTLEEGKQFVKIKEAER